MNTKISDSEMEIMKIIWENGGEVTSAELCGQLGGIWKPTTVLTFLKRLCDKGVLSARREGKANCYSALLSREEYKHRQTEEFVRQMHKGSVKSLLASLYDGEKPAKDDIEEIKKWFEEI